jgi:hypothetical protein
MSSLNISDNSFSEILTSQEYPTFNSETDIEIDLLDIEPEARLYPTLVFNNTGLVSKFDIPNVGVVTFEDLSFIDVVLESDPLYWLSPSKSEQEEYPPSGSDLEDDFDPEMEPELSLIISSETKPKFDRQAFLDALPPPVENKITIRSKSETPNLSFIDSLISVVVDDSKKFRLAVSKILLVYSGYLDKSALSTHLNKDRNDKIWITHMFPSPKIDFKSSFVLIEFNGRIDWRSLRPVTFEGQIPRIYKIPQTKNSWLEMAKMMCSVDKSHTELSDLIENHKRDEKSLASKIWECPDVQTALQRYGERGDSVIFSQVSAVFSMKPKDPGSQMSAELPQKWQQTVLEWFDNGKASCRTCLNVWEKDGNSGKTYFCKWLSVHRPDKVAVLSCIPTEYHLATIIRGCIERGWDATAVVINVPRHECFTEFYGSLEKLMDGILTALKYNGIPMSFDPPKVVVFSNYPLNKDKLSIGKIQHWKLEEGKYLDRSLHKEMDGGLSEIIPKGISRDSTCDEIVEVYDDKRGRNTRRLADKNKHKDLKDTIKTGIESARFEEIKKMEFKMTEMALALEQLKAKNLELEMRLKYN